MTEAGPVLSMCMSFAKNPSPVKPGSAGTVVRNAEMKVVDTETGKSVSYNQPGEICIRGKQIMKGKTRTSLLYSLELDRSDYIFYEVELHISFHRSIAIHILGCRYLADRLWKFLWHLSLSCSANF